jgi:hypothetical protein
MIYGQALYKSPHEVKLMRVAWHCGSTLQKYIENTQKTKFDVCVSEPVSKCVRRVVRGIDDASNGILLKTLNLICVSYYRLDHVTERTLPLGCADIGGKSIYAI